MYKKSTDIAMPFKPKKMIVNGITYEVDSIATLEKIRADTENKKKENLVILEEQKNQKVLTRRTRTKNNEDKIVKEIRDANELKAIHALKERQAKQIKTKDMMSFDNKKPQFSMIAKAGVRKPLTVPITMISPLLTQQNEELIVDTMTTIQQKPLNMIKHNQTPINRQGPKLNINNDITNDKRVIQLGDINQSNQPVDHIIEKPQTLNVTRQGNTKIKTLYNSPGLVETQNINDDTELPTNLDTTNARQRTTLNNENIDPEAHADTTGYFNKTFEVLKTQWYMLLLRLEGNLQGLVKIMDDSKRPIIPTVKINNDMFLFKKYDTYYEYKIYLQTLATSRTIDIHIIGLLIKDIKLQQISFDVVSKGIDVWKFRKLHDLEFIDYYTSKLKLDCTEKFIEKFKADYELYKNQTYLDTYIKSVKMDKKK